MCDLRITSVPKVFLLSPASAHGRRAHLLLREQAQFPLAQAFQREGAPIGEVFRFISGLYFRGKLAYAETFAAAPPGVAPVLIITPGEGLVTPDTWMTRADLERSAGIPIEGDDPRYREPLEKHARQLAEASCDCPIVLLGKCSDAQVS